jgi:hypothetical protein
MLSSKHIVIAASLLATLNLQAQQPVLNDCSGMAVESGTFNSAWKAAWGKWQDNNGTIFYDVYNEEFKTTNHRIWPVGSGSVTAIPTAVENIPRVRPGLSYSIQLGNQQAGRQFERLETAFQVDTSSSLIQVHFAVILQNPDHSATDQPKFEFKAIDQNGNTLPCGDYQVVASGNIPGFKSYGNRIFRNWTTASIDLRNYIGQVISLQFSTYDCSAGGHFGMALFAIECLEATIKPAVFYCPGVDTTIKLEAPGGFRDYVWSNGATDSITTFQNPQPGDKLWVKFKPFSSLSDNCELTLEYEVPGNYDLVLFDAVKYCEGGSTEIIANGPPGASYLWNSMQTTPSVQVNTPGMYTVIATKGTCILQDSVTVIEVENPKGTLEVTNPTCFAKADGEICFIPSNNVTDLSYQWSNNGQESCIQNLTAGMYMLTLTEGQIGCSSSKELYLDQPLLLEPKIVLLESPGCQNRTEGRLGSVVSGGTTPYIYAWSTGAIEEQATINSEGAYNLTITDANGCASEDSFVVKVPKLELATKDVSCYQTNTGSIVAIGEGGVPPYVYKFQNGTFGSNAQFDSLFSGMYIVSIMDSSGCIVSVEGVIKESRTVPYEIELFADTTVVTLGERIYLEVEPNYYTLDSAISWNTGFELSCWDCFAADGIPLFSGMAKVFAKDTSGCEAADSVYIRVLKNYFVYIPNVFKPGAVDNPENQKFMPFFKIEQVQIVKQFNISNRWGSKVFERRNFMPNVTDAAWDGTIAGREAPSGVYACMVEVLFIDGRTEFFWGDVTLLR